MINLFPITISKTTIQVDWNRDQVLARLSEYFELQQHTTKSVRDLHKEKIFEPLVKYMDQVVAEYWKTLGYDTQYPIELNSLWANKFDKNQGYHVHLDSPSIISVVFYVSKEHSEQGNLYFANPSEHLWQTQPLSEHRRINQKYHEVDVRTGDLLCFPGWLEHGILPNQMDESRISIAGKYELKGLTSIKKFLSK